MFHHDPWSLKIPGSSIRSTVRFGGSGDWVKLIYIKFGNVRKNGVLSLQKRGEITFSLKVGVY
jgi:hypothetical protein